MFILINTLSLNKEYKDIIQLIGKDDNMKIYIHAVSLDSYIAREVPRSFSNRIYSVEDRKVKKAL